MAREKKTVHKVEMTEGKCQIIQQLLQEYDIESAEAYIKIHTIMRAQKFVCLNNSKYLDGNKVFIAHIIAWTFTTIKDSSMGKIFSDGIDRGRKWVYEYISDIYHRYIHIRYQ